MIKKDTITASAIHRKVPEPLRSFLAIDSIPLQASYEPVVEAFRVAAKKISPMVRVRKRVYVLFGKAPFCLNLSYGEFRYTPKSGAVINVHLENMVLLDCEKMMHYKFQIQVVSILEELLHTLMNICDEVLVRHVVDLLYEGVKCKDGKYHPVEA